MPFYEYRCDACNHNFEALQKISDDALVECPACHQPNLKKVRAGMKQILNRVQNVTSPTAEPQTVHLRPRIPVEQDAVIKNLNA